MKKLKTKSNSYSKWNSMIARCYNPSQDSYKTHGARGISVCKEWFNFSGFFKDMGECPEGYTLDRIDNNSNYEPGNCRWATPKEQANNRRTNVILKIDGVSKTMAEWADYIGISRQTLWDRIKRGWSGKRLLQPLKD